MDSQTKTYWLDNTILIPIITITITFFLNSATEVSSTILKYKKENNFWELEENILKKEKNTFDTVKLNMKTRGDTYYKLSEILENTEFIANLKVDSNFRRIILYPIYLKTLRIQVDDNIKSIEKTALTDNLSKLFNPINEKIILNLKYEESIIDYLDSVVKVKLFTNRKKTPSTVQDLDIQDLALTYDYITEKFDPYTRIMHLVNNAIGYKEQFNQTEAFYKNDIKIKKKTIFFEIIINTLKSFVFVVLILFIFKKIKLNSKTIIKKQKHKTT